MDLLSFLSPSSERDRFARKVIQRLRVRGWSGPEPTLDRDSYALRFQNGDTLFLENALTAWSRAKGIEKGRQIDIAIGYLFEAHPNGSFEEAKPYLLPVIRNRARLTNFWLTPEHADVRGAYDVAMRPICDDLALLVAIDSATSIELLNNETLEKWDVALDQTVAAAVENLRAISTCKFVRDPGGFWVSDFKDHHDASRLMLPHLFDQLELKGEPVVVALDRACLVAAGAADAEALGALASSCAKNAFSTDRSISCLPMVWRDRAWQPFVPEKPNREAFQRLRVRQSIQDYTEQQALLEQHNAASGADIYVADVDAVKGEDRVDTWATWANSVDTLLPKVDVVALANSEKEHRPRFWSDIETEFGPFTPEPDLYPPRYRLRQWPANAWERAERLAQPDWAATLATDTQSPS